LSPDKYSETKQQNSKTARREFPMTHNTKRIALTAVIITASLLAACTQEQQNKISRDIQNWTGTNGVLEVYAGDKVVRRFLKVDKISTALGTDDGKPRAYRYGYGVLDENLNMQVDSGEKKVYFEVSDYSNTVFFENPR
jgi:opacity protein-like surface antigen